MCKGAIEHGIFRSTSVKKSSTTIQKNQSTSQDDIFIKPDRSQVTGMRYGTYDKLNEKGYAPEETFLENGDILIGKVSPIQPIGNSNKVFKDSSEFYKSHIPGVVDKVYTEIFNNEGYEMRKVRVRSERTPMIGDKFCMTDQVDVLTNLGWINITKITKNHKIATLVNNKYLEYVNPIDIYSWNYKGKMYKLRSQEVDLDCTVDHELYVKKYGHKNFELVPALDVYGKQVKFKKCIENNNPDIEYIKINENKKIKMDDFLNLLSIWISDKDTEGNELVEYFKNYNIDSTNKFLPELVLNLSQRQSRILLESLISNNGSHTNQYSLCYYTYSKQLADDIMKLSIHCGWSGSIKLIQAEEINSEMLKISGKLCKEIKNADVLSVNIIKTNNEPEINTGHTHEHKQFEEFYECDGPVYCLEVPSHVFMIRQNGKNVLVGNCSRH